MAVTIQVSEEVWEELMKNKKRGVTFSKRVEELINIKKSLEREIRDSGKTNIIQISVLNKILEGGEE